MPVSVHLLTDTLNNALSEKFTSQKKTEDNFSEQLVASAKRVILTKIEYEETTQNHNNVLEKLKSKYTILKLNPALAADVKSNNGNSNGGNATQSSYSNSSKQEKSNGLNGNEKNGSGSAATKNQSSGNHLPPPKKILFPRENVRIGWKIDGGRRFNTGVGMGNVGNTCYLNSTLQALFHVPAIAHWLASDINHREKCNGNCIICAMANTLLAAQANQGPIRPQLIYSKLKLICKHLMFGRQEDAHEFLKYLIEAMEKSYLNRWKNWKEFDQHSKETTPLNQILGGYLRNSVSCLSCGHVSTTFQHFEDLVLDISKVNNIEDALFGYFAKENLEESGYTCDSCKKKVSATKKFSLERAPIALCIQLKRFSAMGNKLMKSINIGEYLDLKPYLSRTATNHGQKHVYRLVSMITHIGGSQNCGHYTAIGLSPNNSYYQFDDSCVRPITIDCVLRTNAYVLFYELEQQHDNVTNGGPMVNGVSKTTLHNGNHAKHQEPLRIIVKQTGHLKTGEPTWKIGNSSLKLQDNSLKFASTSKSNENPGKSNENVFKFGATSKSQETAGKSQENSMHSKRQENETTPKVTNFVTPLVPSCILKQQQNHQKETTPTKTQLPPSPTTPTSSPKSTVPSKNLFTSKIPQTPKKEDASRKSKTPSPVRSGKHSLETESLQNHKKQKTENIFSDSESDGEKEPRRNFVQLPHMPKLMDDDEPSSSKYSVESRNGEAGPSKRDSSTESTNSRKSHQDAKKNKIERMESSKSLPETLRKSTESPVLLKKCNSDGNLCPGPSKSRVMSPLGVKYPAKPAKLVNESKKLHVVESVKKPKSLVPYGTDDDESEQEEFRKKKEAPKLVKNQSGVWQVSDLKENNCPSKQGSTVESTKVEKNGDVVQELEKYSHQGYGAPVSSWSGQQTQMEKELARDKQEERKRQLEDDRETEMDRGRTKKIKYGHENVNSKKLLNPFSVKQNQVNNKSQSHHYYQGNHGNQSNYQNSQNSLWIHGNGRHHNHHGHNRPPYFNQNNQNRPHHSNNQNYRKFNNNQKYYNNHNRWHNQQRR